MGGGPTGIKWLRIRAYSTMNSEMGPLPLKAGFDWWEGVVNDANTRAPAGVDKAFQFTGKC